MVRHRDEPGPAVALGGVLGPAPALSPGLIRLMTITCTVTVANLYYAQPLLHAIGAALHVSQTAAFLLVTAGQVGYAAGLLLVVPIGDIARRRPLLAALLAVDTLALAASAIAPDLAVLGALAVIIGVTSVVVQMLVPYAATLAPDEQRSGVIGTLMSGLLIGILLSRTFAGIIAQVAGWRVVYGAAAAAMAVTTVALWIALPDHPRELAVGRPDRAGWCTARRLEPGSAGDRRAGNGRLRPGHARGQPEHHLRSAARGPVAAHHDLHDHVLHRRGGGIGGRVAGL